MHRPVVALSALLCFSCGPTPLRFAGAAVESLPQQALPSTGVSTGLSIAGEPTLAGFFKQECHMVPEDNYCPAGVNANSNGGKNDSKFTVSTLLGLIYHAEIYGGGLRTGCGGKAVKVSSSSYVATTATGSDADRFVLDTNGLFTCLEKETWEGTDRYALTSAQADYQATLTTRHKAVSGGGGPETDVLQVVVSLDAQKAPTFLAFNWAGVSTMAGRAVLLVNLRTHRFAVKYLTGPAAQARFVSAIGVGGVDRTSGKAHAGFYRARFSREMGGPGQACIDNGTQYLEQDDTECVKSGVPITWTSSDPVATWLDLTAAERTRLAPFLAKFTDDGPLAATETPTGLADADLYFPARIE